MKRVPQAWLLFLIRILADSTKNGMLKKTPMWLSEGAAQPQNEQEDWEQVYSMMAGQIFCICLRYYIYLFFVISFHTSHCEHTVHENKLFQSNCTAG